MGPPSKTVCDFLGGDRKCRISSLSCQLATAIERVDSPPTAVITRCRLRVSDGWIADLRREALRRGCAESGRPRSQLKRRSGLLLLRRSSRSVTSSPRFLAARDCGLGHPGSMSLAFKTGAAAGLQSYVVFMAGVSSASNNADAARSLIKFLTAAAAAPVFKAKDMEPG